MLPALRFIAQVQLFMACLALFIFLDAFWNGVLGLGHIIMMIIGWGGLWFMHIDLIERESAE